MNETTIAIISVSVGRTVAMSTREHDHDVSLADRFYGWFARFTRARRPALAA